MRNFWLYGPPGSGKTTLGKLLAGRLLCPFIDLDGEIEKAAGCSIAEIFQREGEEGFRARETQALVRVVHGDGAVVSLGGGALVNAGNRVCAEQSGSVVCLSCSEDELLARIGRTEGSRPLVAGDDARVRLHALLEKRRAHYDSFVRVDSAAARTADVILSDLEEHFGAYRITSGDRPSDIRVSAGGLDEIGAYACAREKCTRCVIVCDAHTAPLYGARVAASFEKCGVAASVLTIPAGESTKNLETVQRIWSAFLASGLGRGDLAVAVGGGVTGDLTGFAAATWMRGIRWVNVPTSLLAMVDASTGGKTGCDLSSGKNLVGAFHSPDFVLADVSTLMTLPAREWRCGLAEMAKHALIDVAGEIAQLSFFDFLAALHEDACPSAGVDLRKLAACVSRALAVKVRVVREDPCEKGIRAKLNLGHTVGHAIETLTDYRVKHGEAVAIGTVEEARLAVRLKMAPPAWPDDVAQIFARLGLPVTLPAGLTFADLVPVMRRDKKKQGTVVRFALPIAPGDVQLVPVDLAEGWDKNA